MLGKYFVSYLIARGGPGMMAFAAIAIFTRLLSPDQYGEYVIVVSYAGVLSAFLHQWLRIAVLRYLPGSENRESFLASVYAVFLATTLLTCLAGIFVWLATEETTSRATVLAVVLTLASLGWFELQQQIANAELAPKRYGALGYSRAFLSLVVGSVMAWLGFGSSGLIAGAIFGYLIPSCIDFYRDATSVRLSHFNQATIRQLFSYGWPLACSQALSVVIYTCDRIILSWFCTKGEVGLYGASFDLSQNTLGMLMMIVNLGAYPLAVKALQTGSSVEFQRQMSDNFLLVFGVAFPAMVGMIVIAPNISDTILGASFQSSGEVLIPLLAVLAFLGGLRSFYFDLAFQLSGKTKGQFSVMFLATALNIIFNLLAVPMYGARGAVFASILALGIALIASWKLGQTALKLPVPVRRSAQIMAGSGLLAVCLWMCRDYRGWSGLAVQGVLAAVAQAAIFIWCDVAGVRTWLLRFYSAKACAKEVG